MPKINLGSSDWGLLSPCGNGLQKHFLQMRHSRGFYETAVEFKGFLLFFYS